MDNNCSMLDHSFWSTKNLKNFPAFSTLTEHYFRIPFACRFQWFWNKLFFFFRLVWCCLSNTVRSFTWNSISDEFVEPASAWNAYSHGQKHTRIRATNEGTSVTLQTKLKRKAIIITNVECIGHSLVSFLSDVCSDIMKRTERKWKNERREDKASNVLNDHTIHTLYGIESRV